MSDWQENLETVGVELFQRYRKRLLMPGIAMQIREDYPGLSLLDVLIRVHAGRQIIRDGNDFHALHAIRCGCWQLDQTRNETASRRGAARGEGFSRLLVILGGVLFVGFCLLSLLASWSGGAGVLAIVVPVLVLGLIGRHGLSGATLQGPAGSGNDKQQRRNGRDMPVSV